MSNIKRLSKEYKLAKHIYNKYNLMLYPDFDFNLDKLNNIEDLYTKDIFELIKEGALTESGENRVFTNIDIM